MHNSEHRVTGLILHGAMRYDLTVWLFTRGRERSFREKLLAPLKLSPGEAVLDIGCGTGGLAIAAKRQVGPAGMVHGIDASPEMVARAERKARGAVAFEVAPAQMLPFPDRQFDAVVSTLMFHHLPRKARVECACEMRRVLKPGGRALVVDFAESSEPHRMRLFAHQGRHGHTDLSEIVAYLSDAGLTPGEQGPVGVSSLQFALATAPAVA